MANSLSIKMTTKLFDNEGNVGVKDVFEGTRASTTERNFQRFSLADSVSDQQIEINNVDSFSLLIVRADQDITIKIGGTEADRAIDMTPTLTDNNGTVWAIFAVCADGDTLAYLSNSSGLAANIEVLMV